MPNQGLIRPYAGAFSSAYRLIDVCIYSISLWLALALGKQSVELLYVVVGMLSLLCYFLAAEGMQLYHSWRTCGLRRQLNTVISAWLISSAATLCVLYYVLWDSNLSREVISLWLITNIIGLISWRIIFRIALNKLRFNHINTRNVAIIGANQTGNRLLKQVKDHPHLGLKVVGFYDDRELSRLELKQLSAPLLGNVDNAVNISKAGKLDYIYLALPLCAEHRIRELLRKLSDTTATVHIIPNFFVYNLLHARWDQIGEMQTLSIYDTPHFGLSGWLKRVEDLVLASAILVLISPLMIIIALAIKLTSKGSVFFRQDRYGLDGKKIRMWKFRSMTSTDNGAEIIQARKNDSRVTPIGRFLRRTSLDELPQFFNVLEGSMSVVGPRPHAVAHNEHYRSLIEGYMLRHKVKPGITGWAQINGWRGETNTLEKMAGRIECDLEYIHNWSLWMDIKIISKTIVRGFISQNSY